MDVVIKHLRRGFGQQTGGTPTDPGDSPKQQGVIWAYTAAIAGAEVLGAFGSQLGGVICHAILLPWLLSHSVLTRKCGIRQTLPVLALIPTLRLLSLVTATPHVQSVYWYAMVGLPLLLAVALTARLLQFTWADLGLQLSSLPPQLMISLSAIPLSLAAYLLVGNTLYNVPDDGTYFAFAAAFVLVIFSGMLEEVIFRGLLLQATKTVFGSWAIAYSSLLYAVVHVGWQSVEFVAFAAVVGLFWGWCAMRTGSIWGVIFAHGMLNAYMFLWPILWR